ncbi:hypothetical protein AGRA3207_004467 [Actinomadura graeca]|uniref:Uncharacterized protein n=1 Tax=Actinomadura graeca TaxID=2750812 RepID=A0ABX8QWZ7_9ACTN|nr:hypothetical protein [Actinomadura graeca]QXJ23326.1 hypothetical protein AGRA3207_004467 [Actinomadura graeca]
MSADLHLVSSAAIGSGEIRDLVVSLGGEPQPAAGAPDVTVLVRGDGAVVVYPFPPDEPIRAAALREECARALGAPPRTRIVLEVLPGRESEWIAAEIVLAAADRWPLAIRDFGEAVITVAELYRRLARRRSGFFRPEDREAPLPGRRRTRVDEATLLLPGGVTPERFARIVRSLGGRLAPDDRADAVLERAGAWVWVRLRPPGAPPVDPSAAALHDAVLGPPPYTAVVLEIFEGTPSQLLAAELVEAAAEHWPLMVRGGSGQAMTADDVRARVAMGAADIFDP